MAALITQAEAIAQLRLNEAALTVGQLADLMFKADQATAIIVDYLKVPHDVPAPPFVPPPPAGDLAPSVPPLPAQPWTTATVPVLVKAAILIVLTALYDGRTPEDTFLSPSLTAILERLRDPALA